MLLKPNTDAPAGTCSAACFALALFSLLFSACSPAPQQSDEKALTEEQRRQIADLSEFGDFEGMDVGPIQRELRKEGAGSPSQPPDDSADRLEMIEQLNAIGYVAGTQEATLEAGVTLHDRDRACPGPSLYTSGHALEAILIDMEGHELHKWRCSYEKAFPGRKAPSRADWHVSWRYSHCFGDGTLLAIVEGQGLIKLDRDSNLLWVLEDRAHHDLKVLENGDIYVLTRTAHMVPRINPMRPILEDFITLLDAGGAVKRRVSVLEAVERSEYRDAVFGKMRGDGDILHTNALQWLDGSLEHVSPLFRRGNILTSFKDTNSVAIVDMEEERLVWHMQGPWVAQHKPVLLPDATMLLFDNNRFGGASSVLIFNPLSTGPDIVWQYTASPPESFYTDACGAAQPLCNGNLLVTVSEMGYVFEVTPEKETVWRFVSPYRPTSNPQAVAYLYEMIRLPKDFCLDWTYENRKDWPEGWKQ